MSQKDLISREALMQFPIRRNHYDRENGNEHFISGIETVLEYAQNLPAVDAVPVVHGRWVLKTRREADNALIVTAECSQGCENEREIWRGYFIDVPDYIAEYTALSKAKMAHLSNYCPNCGAKMDKEA